VPHLLRAKGLAKSYKGRQVVHDTTLEVASGEIVGLLGPNGAGKTTSFYMIIGLVKADAGEVWLDDTELSQAGMARRAKQGIGYLPQEASIFRKLSVADNVMAILETRGELSAARRQEMLEALLREFHIEHLRDSLGMRLSGGERRRVEIARAMAMEPLFMLLDEPFAGVDPISVNDIKGIIRNLSAKGVGVLITDHNVRETLDICHQAYIFNAGGVLAQGEPWEILQDAQVRAVYLGEGFAM
jgi:lipopolysaccharide export system ATP-binding protein